MAKRNFFLFFVFAVSLLKLVLVAGNEIVASPDDSESYMRQAANHLFELGVPPGYPFWLAFSKFSGLPQRVSIEFLLVASSLILSGMLRRLFGEICGALCFAMLVLSPATYFMFDYSLSDGFYASLGILAIAFSAATIFSQSTKAAAFSAVLLGLSMGWMALSRNEDPLLIAWIVLTVALCLIFAANFDSKLCLKTLLMRALLVSAAIAAPAVAIVQGVNLLHLQKSGVFARTLAALPGHTRLLQNLAEIDSAETSIRYVPISAKARFLAYRASPTLAKYEGSVEDRANIFQVVSRQVGIAPGEIGAGWIWHAFNMYVLQSNGIVGAKGEYDKINEELDAAFNAGVLKKRRVLHPFATAPLLDIGLRLPKAAWEVAKKSFQTYPRGTDVGHEKEVFDAVGLRRASMTGSGYKHTVQGWAFVNHSAKKIKSVISVGAAEQNPVTILYMPRLDVAAGIKKSENWEPSVTGFKMSFYSSSKQVGGLLYLLDDGSTVLSASVADGFQSVGSLAPLGLTVHQGIDFTAVEPALRVGVFHEAQAHISKIANYPWVSSALLGVLLVLGIAAIALIRYEPGKKLNISLFVFLVASLFFLRTVFYAILESEAWEVEVRYMLTGNFMTSILISVLLPLCIVTSWKLFRDRTKPSDGVHDIPRQPA